MNKALELSNKYRSLLAKHGIIGTNRLAMFFAQLDHESKLEPISENLNYSAEGLLTTFKKYFNQNTAKQYARQPKMIANKVYANRMGNGNEASGDGWKYRGKGFIQLTGKDNYKALSKSTGTDYVANPELLLNEADAMVSACWFWSKNNLNKHADNKDVSSATKVINGGTNGLSDRKAKFEKYLKVFA